MIPADFDWKSPNYDEVFARRIDELERIRRASAADLELLKAYYRDNISDFIEDFGMTYDPRNVERGLPPIVPFLLFAKQREFVEEVMSHWRTQKPLLVEKSRDGGLSWVIIGIGCSLCVLFDGMGVGYGSRKEEYVDKVDAPKSLFWKARFFMRHLPVEFRAGWREQIDAPHMRMKFPETGSNMTGEAGDAIGRGDRQGIYFVDEAAHLPRPMLVEAALSQTTNCRIDVSSVNGPNNVFAQKRHAGKIDVFVFDWRDDPRKDEEWYDKQVAELDPIVVAQEIDRDYGASVEGIVIPLKWVQASFDALEKLGIAPSGENTLAFDVADEGADKNGAVGGKGVEISIAEEWSGKSSDTFASTEKVFDVCDANGILKFKYDADGLGAAVRGDARVINERRRRLNLPQIAVEAYRGSDAVLDPEKEDVKGRRNEDYFLNRKAQMWWRARTRFLNTYRWVVDGVPCDPNEIVSINTKKVKNYQKLAAELSQPQYRSNDVGKILIQKRPDGMKSPNLGDAAVMKLSGSARRTIKITAAQVARARAARSPSALLRGLIGGRT